MTKEEFNKKTCQYKKRFDLYYFLLNTLSLIKYNSYYYCFCNEKKLEKTKNKKDV